MIPLLRHLAVAGVMLTATLAHATTYTFSYAFDNGDVIEGSFDGTANGNLVYATSNATFSLNNVAAVGPLTTSSSTGRGTAVFSFDGLANNFLLFAGNGKYALLSAAYGGPVTNVINYQVLTKAYAAAPGSEPYAASHWTLAVASAVPEPASYAMLLAGLMLTAVAVRRRQQLR